MKKDIIVASSYSLIWREKVILVCALACMAWRSTVYTLTRDHRKQVRVFTVHHQALRSLKKALAVMRLHTQSPCSFNPNQRSQVQIGKAHFQPLNRLE
jgi:hypothetical protein